jgi:hypothetical protein
MCRLSATLQERAELLAASCRLSCGLRGRMHHARLLFDLVDTIRPDRPLRDT